MINIADEKLEKVGVIRPNILFPNKNVDLQKFSVVACDQYSAKPEYWDEVEAFVGKSPSALNLMMPEARLDQKKDISSYMNQYLKEKTLVDIGKGFMFIHRQTSSGVRRGLVLALDLEQYDFTPGSSSLIRATEKTVVERLPARIEIRKTASIEMPHVMVLINDKLNKLMGYLDNMVSNQKPMYDFDLMKNSGNIKGWFLQEDNVALEISEILLSLKQDGFLFAMGDGNHSFAAAKAHWDNIKKTLSDEERKNHPARYSMAEIVNLYDEALLFEPIHRLVTNVDKNEFLSDLQLDLNKPMSLQDLQPKIDKWMENHPKAELEYIHGKEECQELAKKQNGIAITWDKFDKDSLFSDVLTHGVLCRKTFSMGKADDKRFYLECRKIV